MHVWGLNGTGGTERNETLLPFRRGCFFLSFFCESSRCSYGFQVFAETALLMYVGFRVFRLDETCARASQCVSTKTLFSVCCMCRFYVLGFGPFGSRHARGAGSSRYRRFCTTKYYFFSVSFLLTRLEHEVYCRRCFPWIISRELLFPGIMIVGWSGWSHR